MRPQEEQPQWRGSSGNLDSAPAGTPSAGPGGSGAGPLICSAPGRNDLAVLGPPGLCLSRGRPAPGLCPGALCSGACAVGFALPGRAAPSAEPPPEPLQLLRVPPGPAVRAAALGELGALSWARRCLLVSQGARGHPRPPGSRSNSPRAPFPREGRCSSCSSGTGLSCPGDTRPGLSPAPRGAPPPWRPLFLYFFFPVFLP